MTTMVVMTSVSVVVVVVVEAMAVRFWFQVVLRLLGFILFLTKSWASETIVSVVLGDGFYCGGGGGGVGDDGVVWMVVIKWTLIQIDDRQ